MLLTSENRAQNDTTYVKRLLYIENQLANLHSDTLRDLVPCGVIERNTDGNIPSTHGLASPSVSGRASLNVFLISTCSKGSRSFT